VPSRHSPLEVFQDLVDPVPVLRELGAEGFPARVEHGAHEVQGQEEKENDDHDGDRLGNPKADEDIQDGRQDKIEEQGQAEGEQDGLGDPQDDPGQDDDDKAHGKR